MSAKSCFGIRVNVAIAILWFAAFSIDAHAENYPFSGYFSIQATDTSPGFKQAKCAFEFFKQNSDGTATDYFLDFDKFKIDGTVSYVVVDTTVCTYYSPKNSDHCSVTDYDRSGSQVREQFDLYESRPNTDNSYVVFANEAELDEFVRSKEKSLPNNKFPTALRLYMHRCEGFDDSALDGHLTRQLNVLSPDETFDMFTKTIGNDEIPPILNIMQKIGKSAFNATLPGQ